MRCSHLWVMVAGVFWLAGCGEPKATRIDLTTFDEVTGTSRQYCAEFTRASYRRSPAGMVELVLRGEGPSKNDPRQIITQIVYIKQFWNPRPGTTYAEATQINAHVQYAILSPPTGMRYDGAAFITYKINRRTGELTGRIESGDLKPRYSMGGANASFGPATFTGTFRAHEDPGEVVNTIQLLETTFSKRPGN